MPFTCTGDWLTILTCLDTSSGGAFGALLSGVFFIIYFVGSKVLANNDAMLAAGFLQAITVVLFWWSGVIGFGVLLFWGIVLMIVGGVHFWSK